ILEWNRAFEEAGVRNAIQVLDAPDDSLWSAEDARYSTVRWMANNAFTYAIGPSDVDPRTGEILNADILVAASWIQAWQGDFRGTAGIPMDKLFDRAYTATHGTSASVMDYNPPAIALDRSKQGDYYSRTIGTYDRWAIRYGYATVAGDTPDAERAGLRDMAAQASDPDHVYGTDEDAGFAAYGLDPTVTRYDQ